MKVFAPNKQYTGTSASVPFCNGVGETEDPRLLHWFKSHGYKVEDLPKSEDPAEDKREPKEENPESPEENVEKEHDKEVKKGKSANQKAGE